ncbi:alpha/beta hydrolase, partial [Amycolatopsis sp. NPDC000673]
LAAAAGLTTAILPLGLARQAAIETGTSLSAADYLRGGINFSSDPDPARAKIYATQDGQPLPLDFWPPTHLSTRPSPAVVWLHGGGFTVGKQSRYPRWDEWLSGRGFAVFDVAYRLSPPARWADAVGDVKCALGWIVRHATALGVDPQQIVLAGQSAGGALALQAAYTTGDPTLPSSCSAPDVPVRAVVALYPLTDLTAGWNSDFNGELRDSVSEYIGGTPLTQPERYRGASPVAHVHPGDPPTLLIAGTHDSVAGPQAPRLDAALRTSAIPCTFVSIRGADHGFDIQWGGWAAQIARHALDEFLQRYLPTNS